LHVLWFAADGPIRRSTTGPPATPCAVSERDSGRRRAAKLFEFAQHQEELADKTARGLGNEPYLRGTRRGCGRRRRTAGAEFVVGGDGV
jgi:hypothetical protein